VSLSISIAMCTYNGAHYLRQQLQSFVDQTVKPNELIVCDDASSDESVQLVEDFAKTASFQVRIVRNPRNLGYVKNFEQAISLCTKDVILMCDQDDVWVAEKIQTMVIIFEQNPTVGLVMHDFQRIDANSLPYPSLNERYGVEQIASTQLEEYFKSNSIMAFMRPYPRAWYGCMMGFRSQFLPLVLPIYPGKGHDDWIMKLLAPVTDVYFISQALILYRVHPWNTNSHSIGHSKAFIQWFRFKKRFWNIILGYSKKNFYRNISHRLKQSEMNISNPEVWNEYKRWI
jgi:glycosyltransferase involved in cell wall biosynthesis